MTTVLESEKKMARWHIWSLCTGLLLSVVLVSCANYAPATGMTSQDVTSRDATNHDVVIYADSLGAGWKDWSWGSTRSFAAAQPHSGTQAIGVAYTEGWGGLSLRTGTPLTGSDYTSLTFWGYGAAGGTQLAVYIQTGDETDSSTTPTVTLPGGQWTQVVIPLADLGNPAAIARITWQNNTDQPQPIFYVDDIRLVAKETTPPPVQIELTVDAAAARQPISPDIYGINQYDMAGDPVLLMQELGVTVRHWGGNHTSRYNYQTNISNHASDWFFNNYRQSNAQNLPHDSVVNGLIDENQDAGVGSLITVPASGYVSNGDGNACSFPTTLYGPQQATASDRPLCGNGIKLDGTRITGNDPLATSLVITESFITGWVNYLVSRYGRADAGGVRFYNLDNEPDIWFETHRDVRPIGVTYDQLRDFGIRYGTAIKQADPSAQVLGPVLMGWTYYWHSPNDGQKELWNTRPDRMAHGDVPLVPWYLGQMRQHEQSTGTRVLDYLDLHYYPQAPGVTLSGAGDAATQARRLRSTRSLWDPTYVDESWIKDAGPDNGIVRLIPRMQEWVDANYPGTKLAITEYNWGALDHINGALAQADVLGIFGREGLDLATLWAAPNADEPGAFAFRMYRNYDGSGGKFGDVRVAAASSDQGQLSIYAAQRSSDQALTLMVINKTGRALAARLSLTHFTPRGPGQIYRYSPANLAAIVADGELPFPTSQVESTFPANSITLIVIPQDPDAPPDPDEEARLHLPLVLR